MSNSCCTVRAMRLKSLPIIVIFILITFNATILAAPFADGADKFLGNISTAAPPSDFMNYWNQVTLENNGKWVNVEPNRDQVNWSSVSAAYDYCKKNKIPYKHHTFVWGEQYPSWMDNLSANDQKAEVEELIKEFGEKFPETAMIDVVNEAREKSPKWKTALGGAGATGYDWIVWSFETARKYCPNAKLFINEYYCEYSLEFVTEYLKMINVLKAKNLIDGIGIQSHDGETKKGFQTGMLKKCLDSLATSGLPLYSTEFDMSGTDEEQLQFYKDIFPIIWEHPAMRGVTLWGWTDSWLLHMKTPKDGRLIVNGQERPALKWLREYIAAHKTTIPTTSSEYHIAQPSTTPFTTEYIGRGIMRMHVADPQSLMLRIVDPAGKVIFSVPQKLYGCGDYQITLSQECIAGCYLVSASGAGVNATSKIVLSR